MLPANAPPPNPQLSTVVLHRLAYICILQRLLAILRQRKISLQRRQMQINAEQGRACVDMVRLTLDLLDEFRFAAIRSMMQQSRHHETSFDTGLRWIACII